MKIKSKDELLVKSFVQTVSSATTFSKRYKKVCHLLEMRPKLSEEQWLRVWRGLYYCIWYSEMTKGCDIMAQKIGTNDDFSMLLTGFKALTNDWFGIDVFRLDKYMYLVRIMINTCVKLEINQLLANRPQIDSNEPINESMDSTDDNQKNETENEIIMKEVDTSDTKDESETKNSSSKRNKSKKRFGKRKDNSKKIVFDIEFKAKTIENILMTVKASIGLTLHITDVFIDELVKVLKELSPKLNVDQRIELYFNILLPFVKLMALTEDNRITNDVKHNVFDKFKNEVLISESIDARKEILQKLMDAMIIIGGNETIGRRNRDSIYDIIGIFKTKLNQLNTTNNNNSLKRKKILIGRGRHKKVKYQLTSSSPFVTSIVPIAVV